MGLVELESFLAALEKSQLLNEQQWAKVQNWQGEAQELARQLVKQGAITRWQAMQLAQGRDAFYLGKYLLLDQIGAGGMGAVFKARQRGFERLVAIKLIKKEALADPQAHDRFLREIATLGAVNHPIIVKAYDADQTGDQTYLVMEYVEGKDLKTWIGEFGRLPLDWSCEVIMQAARGLQHAHEKGLVHRDIKPSNILIISGENDALPQAKILDLGLARFTDQEADGGHNLTHTGQVMGTIDYMSPEQARSTKHVDIRADIFSLGCALFKLLTGEVPFNGNNVMEKLMARTRTAPRLRTLRGDIPPELDDVMARMLAVSPNDRFSTPQEVVQALAPFAMSTAGATEESSSLVIPRSDSTVMDLRSPAPVESQLQDFLAQLSPSPAASETPPRFFHRFHPHPWANRFPSNSRRFASIGRSDNSSSQAHSLDVDWHGRRCPADSSGHASLPLQWR